MKNNYPRKIICLTEEPVEWLYLLGEEWRIAGVSCYVKRPAEAKKHPVTSAFTHANLKKIISMNPDLVIGHSDIQKDIARDLVASGTNVYIANHRSLDETLDYLLFLGRMVEKEQKAIELVSKYKTKIEYYRQLSSQLNRFPKVYLVEWDEPMISGIRYFSEVFRAIGARDIFGDISDRGILGKDRVIEWDRVRELDPDIYLSCWCGKALELESVKQRQGWSEMKFSKSNMIFELQPEIFLQPGPALFEDGLDYAYSIIKKWSEYDSVSSK